MIYQEKVSFNGKEWYQLEWNDIEFNEFTKLTKDCNSIEDLEELVNSNYPDSNLKVYSIKWKQNTSKSIGRSTKRT